MLSASLVLKFAFSAIAIDALALTVPTESRALSLVKLADHTNSTSNLTHPVSVQNTPVSAPHIVHCDGDTYQRGLSVPSCEDAIGRIPDDTEELTFGDRGEGVSDVLLPLRYISGKQSLRLSLVR